MAKIEGQVASLLRICRQAYTPQVSPAGDPLLTLRLLVLTRAFFFVARSC